MSIWYIYVNHTKKEYFSTLEMGYSLKEWPYLSTLLPIIGFLHIKAYNTSQLCDGNHDEDLIGHWAGDDCELVREQTEIYDEIEVEEDKSWTNISEQLLKDYNKHIDELSEFWLDDDEKKKLFIPWGPFYKK